MLYLSADVASVDGCIAVDGHLLFILPPSPPDSSAVALSLPTDEDHSLSKRSSYYSSFTGVYNREPIARLDRVCEHCYNLYRDAKVDVACRQVPFCKISRATAAPDICNCFLLPSDLYYLDICI